MAQSTENVIAGQPPDDPGCNLTGRLLLPDPANFTYPRPGVAMTVAGGFSDGDLGRCSKVAAGLVKAGYITLVCNVRLLKDGQHAGLPGQTTTGTYHQQTDDMKILIRYLRADSRCNGFVATCGGSGSGHHSLYAALNIDATYGDDLSDASICMSPPTDFGDRTPDPNLQAFIDIVEAYGESTDTTYLTSISPVAIVGGAGSSTRFRPFPAFIHHSNGDREAMPIAQLTNFQTAINDAGAGYNDNYTSIELVGVDGGGQQHSFGEWPFIQSSAINFLNNAVTAWQSGGSGVQRPEPKGLFCLLSAPDGHIGDLTGRKFLTQDNMVGCRMRLRWSNLQISQFGYDPDELDAALAICKTNGKAVGLSFAGGCCSPDFVFSTMGVNNITLGSDDQTVQGETQLPMPWDAAYYSLWQAFVAHMGGNYDQNPLIRYVITTGPWQNVAMNFVQTADDLLQTNTLAQAAGFADTEAALMDCLITHDRYFAPMAADFPNTKIITTLDRPLPGAAGDRIYDAVRAYLLTLGDQFGTMTNGGRATLPPHNPPSQSVTWPRGVQPISSSTHVGLIYEDPQPDPYPLDPQPLDDMYAEAYENGNKFVEPYSSDAENPDAGFQQINSKWAAIFNPQTLPPPGDPPVITSALVASITSGQAFTYEILATNNPTLYGAIPLTGTGLNINQNTGVISGIAGDVTETTDFNISISATNQYGNSDPTILVLTINPKPTNVSTRTPILLYPKGGRPPVPLRAPDPPINVNVTVPTDGGDTTAFASWDPPLFDGGAPITGYVDILSGFGNGVIRNNGTGADNRTADITDLTPNSLYTFSIKDQNAFGFSSLVQVPFQTLPGAQTPPPPHGDVRGVFAQLYQGTDDFPMFEGWNFYDKSYVDGLWADIPWFAVEPTFDPNSPTRTYVFSRIAALLTVAGIYGKKVILNFTGGMFAPDWFKHLAGNINLYTPTGGPYTGSMVLPWVRTNTYLGFILDMATQFNAHDSVLAVTATGFGQHTESVLAQNTVDTNTLTTQAGTAGFASVVDGWLRTAQTSYTNTSGNWTNPYILIAPELPVPAGTPVKDGPEGLDELASFVRGRVRAGFVSYGFNSISDDTTKRISITKGSSRQGFAAGYKLSTISTDANLDPTQDPTSYDATTGFVNALTNASTQLGKFVVVFPEDADNTAGGYVTAMTNAQTALAVNP